MSQSADFELDTFYRTLAPYYDLIYGHLFAGEDIAFYVEMATASPGPVLEMGCGTGRVLLPLARAGVSMWGMDSSIAMLEQLCAALKSEDRAVRERVTVLHADIRHDYAGCRFPLIIAAGNVLHSFLDRLDQRAWFRNVRRHLAPGGVFCFDLFQFDYRRLSLAPEEWRLDLEGFEDEPGRNVQCYSRCEHDAEAQKFRLEMCCKVTSARGEHSSTRFPPVTQRWFTRGEVEALLECEGFRVADFLGSSDKPAFGRGSWQRVVRAVAAESDPNAIPAAQFPVCKGAEQL
jgi:SAM-dependent methyltransferase